MRFNGILSRINLIVRRGQSPRPIGGRGATRPTSVSPCEKYPTPALRSLRPLWEEEADTSKLEEEIDSIVYKLYGLTDDEIKAVEKAVKK